MGTEIQKTNSNNVVTPLISPNLSVFLNENNELSVMDADRDVKPVSDFVSGSSGTSGQNGNSGSSGTSGQNGAGLGGTNYIVVAANGTDTENAAELQAAYNTAKTMSPSATNRITIVAANGYYNFGSSAFVMDTQYIDLVSLDGNRSIIFNSVNQAGKISITANDVFVKGVDVQTNKNFTIADNLNLLKVENCRGGEVSFGGDSGIASGTFTNCQGGNFSFGGDRGIASGIFTNCQGGDHSFGAEASGTFTNCQGGNFSFGSAAGFSIVTTTASGKFIDCQGGDYSFGAVIIGTTTASGTFTNCEGGNDSFGGGSSGTASGTFTNCQGGNFSFGGATLSGKLYYCRLTSGTFVTVSGGGITRLCIDGNNNENNQG